LNEDNLGQIEGQLSLDLDLDSEPTKTSEEEEPRDDLVLVHPKFPMSVALIGAPGVGKEDIAKKFIEIASPWLSEQGEEIVYIENPGNVISERFDVAMGQFGDYRESLWAFFNRLEQERLAEINGKSYIVSGTILESLAHAGIKYEITMLGADSGIITPETQFDLQKLQIAMTLLTYLFVDNFRYKFAFYVPRSESIIIPGQEESLEDRFSRRIDTALGEIFRNFQLRLQVLDQPTNQDRAQAMFDTIKKIYEEGIEVPREVAAASNPQ